MNRLRWFWLVVVPSMRLIRVEGMVFLFYWPGLYLLWDGKQLLFNTQRFGTADKVLYG